MTASARYKLVAGLVAAACFTAATRAQDVLVRAAGDQLTVAAPSLRFITGRSLDTLRNGNAVAFDVQVSILADSRSTVLRRSFERFVVSYDLWEERFSVTRMRSVRASVSHLSAQQVESWCLDKFTLPASGLPADRPLWVRVDVRAQNGRNVRTFEDDGLSIGALIELFSRQAKSADTHQWRAESGSFTLAELRRTR